MRRDAVLYDLARFAGIDSFVRVTRYVILCDGCDNNPNVVNLDDLNFMAFATLASIPRAHSRGSLQCEKWTMEDTLGWLRSRTIA